MQRLLESKPIRALTLLMVMAVFTAGYATVADAGLISTSKTEITQQRAQDLTTVRQALENKVINERLSDLGFTQQEIDQRLAMLSDQEISQLATDIQNVDTAGDGVGIVVGVLLILLIVLALLEITGEADNF